MKLRAKKISRTRDCMGRYSEYIVRITYCTVNLRDISCNFKSNGEKKIALDEGNVK